MIALPNGYSLGDTKRRQAKAQATFMGGEWEIDVFYKGVYAFEMRKQFNVYEFRPKYAGRLAKGKDWIVHDDLPVLVKIMCAKHRIIGG